MFKGIVANYPYILVIVMFTVGFYLLITRKDLIQKLMGLNLIQASVIVFYICVSYIRDAIPPVIEVVNNEAQFNNIYSNPVPHVLMLTAIVVGIATTAVACALIYKIKHNYGTIKENELTKMINKEEL